MYNPIPRGSSIRYSIILHLYMYVVSETRDCETHSDWQAPYLLYGL